MRSIDKVRAALARNEWEVTTDRDGYLVARKDDKRMFAAYRHNGGIDWAHLVSDDHTLQVEFWHDKAGTAVRYLDGVGPAVAYTRTHTGKDDKRPRVRV